jgi:SAM-dependent methyltransferase
LGGRSNVVSVWSLAVSDVRRSYDAVAGHYAREFGSELDGKPLDRALLGAIAEMAAGGPIADVGCGPGQVAAYLATLGAGVIGVDISPRMCSIANRTGPVPASAGDARRLPLASGSLAAIVCLYTVIHLDTDSRAAAYKEFFRVLRPGGQALIGFHVFDDDARPGAVKTRTEWWGQDVDLTFRFLDPDQELASMTHAGLAYLARLDRAPYPRVEHPSHRTYLLVRRSG